MQPTFEDDLVDAEEFGYRNLDVAARVLKDA